MPQPDAVAYCMVSMLSWIFPSTPGSLSWFTFNVLLNVLRAVPPLVLFSVRKEAALLSCSGGRAWAKLFVGNGAGLKWVVHGWDMGFWVSVCKGWVRILISVVTRAQAERAGLRDEIALAWEYGGMEQLGEPKQEINEGTLQKEQRKGQKRVSSRCISCVSCASCCSFRWQPEEQEVGVIVAVWFLC